VMADILRCIALIGEESGTSFPAFRQMAGRIYNRTEKVRISE
jgi:hypothetical protein